ncbi:magnesium transporter MRS2-I-like isoform X3 [Cicer arietinum]|uniref:Magnesium transporter n=1 Tax=Cicer arietinum TaxID=3827 RepID=A0A1S2XS96_CICAR|nr:magnesium transporter MRS2-I-like isoform X3 [Cicer arietinum]
MAVSGSETELRVQATMIKTTISRSWVLLDRDGRDTVLDVDKYAIMRLVEINARDLRILDPLLSYPSTILGREKVIVLNLEHIKAVITADEVLVRDPMDDDVIPVVEELRRRLPLKVSFGGQDQGEEESSIGEQNEFPFEFRALEVVLEAICSFLDARTRELETTAYPALDELTSKIREELENLLDDDDDMAELYLSRKLGVSSSPSSSSSGPNWHQNSPNQGSKIHKSSRGSATTLQEENDVEELEMLLEAYFVQIDGTLNKLTTLREYIDDTEDYINIQLDNHRNKLIQLELFLSSGTVCLSIYSLVVAIFGMNIPYTWREDHGYVFKWVVIFTGMACSSVFLSVVSYARRKGLVGS